MKKKFLYNIDFIAMIIWSVYFIFVLILYQLDTPIKTLMLSSLVALTGLMVLVLRAVIRLISPIVKLLKALTDNGLPTSQMLTGKAEKPKSEEKQ